MTETASRISQPDPTHRPQGPKSREGDKPSACLLKTAAGKHKLRNSALQCHLGECGRGQCQPVGVTSAATQLTIIAGHRCKASTLARHRRHRIELRCRCLTGAPRTSYRRTQRPKRQPAPALVSATSLMPVLPGSTGNGGKARHDRWGRTRAGRTSTRHADTHCSTHHQRRHRRP